MVFQTSSAIIVITNFAMQYVINQRQLFTQKAFINSGLPAFVSMIRWQWNGKGCDKTRLSVITYTE